jgi:hypothetical protein
MLSTPNAAFTLAAVGVVKFLSLPWLLASNHAVSLFFASAAACTL